MTSPPPDGLMPTALDQRIEAAVGYGVEELRQHRDGGLLDASHAVLADADREVVAAEQDVTFYRVRLARLAASGLPVDQALFARIERTLDQLATAAAVRDTKQTAAAAALAPMEAAAPRQTPAQIATKDVAALLAIARAPSCTSTSSPTASPWRLPPAPAFPTPSCSTWRRWAWWSATPRTRCTPGSPSLSPTPAAQYSAAHGAARIECRQSRQQSSPWNGLPQTKCEGDETHRGPTAEVTFD